jgi:hypothetical protein
MKRRLERINPLLLSKFILDCDSSIHVSSYEYLTKSANSNLRGVALMRNYRQVHTKSNRQKLLYPLFRVSAWIDRKFNTGNGQTIMFFILAIVFELILSPVLESAASSNDSNLKLLLMLKFIALMVISSFALTFAILKSNQLITPRAWSKIYTEKNKK